MTDTLEQLYTSTAALYERFGLDANSVPPDMRRKYLMEEVGELIAESAIYSRAVATEADMHSMDVYDITCEAADVIVTVLGLLQAHGVRFSSLETACGRVIAKNDAKTAENGYALVGGKIRKALPATGERTGSEG